MRKYLLAAAFVTLFGASSAFASFGISHASIINSLKDNSVDCVDLIGTDEFWECMAQNGE